MSTEHDRGNDGPLPFDGRPPSPERTCADALTRFEQDVAFFDRIVPMFVQAAGDQSSALIDAVRRRDRAQVQHWAHTLKGSLLTIGAMDVAARAEHIEQAALDGRVDGLEPLATRLAAEASVIAAQLSAAVSVESTEG